VVIKSCFKQIGFSWEPYCTVCAVIFSENWSLSGFHYAPECGATFFEVDAGKPRAPVENDEKGIVARRSGAPYLSLGGSRVPR